MHYHNTHNVGKNVHSKEAHIPNIIDMGSFKIDLNAPKRHVPNLVMRDAHAAKVEEAKPSFARKVYNTGKDALGAYAKVKAVEYAGKSLKHVGDKIAQGIMDTA